MTVQDVVILQQAALYAMQLTASTAKMACSSTPPVFAKPVLSAVPPAITLPFAPLATHPSS